MLSPFFINDKQLILSRFPLAQVNRSLQAWDSADEYLLSHCLAEQLISANSRVVIFNDAFGALTTHFCRLKNSDTCEITEQANRDVYCINDSYISSQGIAYNIEQNQLTGENITQLHCLDELPENIDIILFKIPKSKSLLIDQLINIK